MLMKLKDGKSKVLTLSYDDGVKEDIRLMEMLRKCGMKATFNINGVFYTVLINRIVKHGVFKYINTIKFIFNSNCDVYKL